MARIIAIANQKGGVGKTTTAVNLGASLAAAEARVLAVDMDPQGNLSSGLGYPKSEVDRHMYHVLTGEASPQDIALSTALEFLTLLPAKTDLLGVEIELVEAQDRHKRLSAALAPLARDYDYILIDCPPSLGLLTLNSLVAAHSVLVPLQCEYYALEGLSHLVQTVERVRTAYNRQLAIEGILLCMYDKRTILARQVASDVRAHFDGQVFETVIPRNVRLSEAPSFGKPVLLHDIDSAGARGYLQLARELLGRQRRTKRPRARSLAGGRARTHRRTPAGQSE